MLGFLVGTLSLIALWKVLGGHRWHGLGGGRGRWGRHGWGRGWMMRALFRRLDTTPGQEKVILESAEALEALGEKLRAESGRLRRDMAQAFRAQMLDHEPLKAAFTRHDALLEELQREVLVSLGKIHEVLDERQRRIVSELLENGRGYGCGHRSLYGRRCGEGWPQDDVRTTTQTA